MKNITVIKTTNHDNLEHRNCYMYHLAYIWNPLHTNGMPDIWPIYLLFKDYVLASERWNLG